MRKRAAALAVGAGVVLAGCGDGDSGNGVADMEPGEILTEVQEAVAAADTVRLAGEFFVDGEQKFTIDMTYGADNTEGTLGSEGFEFEFVSADGDTYMKASGDTWDEFGGAGLGDLIADSYVLVPADDPTFGDMAEILDRDAFVKEIFSDTADSEGATKGEEAEINGRPVVGVVDEDGAVLHIATTGDPLPVQITAPEGESGALDFEWGIEVDIAAPDEADIVDLSSL